MVIFVLVGEVSRPDNIVSFLGFAALFNLGKLFGGDVACVFETIVGVFDLPVADARCLEELGVGAGNSFRRVFVLQSEISRCYSCTLG